jgi:glycolate oxidase FAD binding subunit
MADVGRGLAEIVGASSVRTGEAAGGFAVEGRRPRWVVAPGSVEEVSRCLALAAAEGLAVAPLGQGTRRHWGSAPRALDVVLALHRLDRILGYEPADLTASVEAGVTLGALETHLRPFRQFLPLDPARAAGSTIGGIVATAASGPYRARYGTIRDLLLGVTVVHADGTVTKSGGRVVKNVSGYDLPKLHVGALGTLGVVVLAHLRLHPRPPTETSWRFDFGSLDAALDAALGIMDAPVVVSRLALLDRGTRQRLGEGEAAAALAVTLGSVPAGVEAQGARIVEICARGGATPAPILDADVWWGRATETTWPGDAAAFTLRVGGRPTDLVKVYRGLEAAVGGALRGLGEVANGVLHVSVEGAEADGGMVGRIREGLAPFGASAVVEHAPPALKPSLDVWGDVGPALEIMRRLKAELDPKGVLNPGRYVGGI